MRVLDAAVRIPAVLAKKLVEVLLLLVVDERPCGGVLPGFARESSTASFLRCLPASARGRMSADHPPAGDGDQHDRPTVQVDAIPHG